MENIDGCKNNPENSSATTVSFFNVYNIVIKSIENKYTGVNRGKDYTEVKIARKFKKKKNKSLINKQQKLYQNAKVCNICQEDLKINMLKTKSILKLEIIVIAQPTNIGPQDVPRTSLSNFLRTSPKDPI